MIKKISEEIYNKIDYVKSIVSIYPDEAIKISKEAYNLAKDNNLIIEEAIKYFLEGYELLKTTKDDSLLSSVLNNIGEVYRESEMYDKAIYYYDQAIEIYNESYNLLIHENDIINLAEIENKIGKSHFEMGNIKNSKEDLISLFVIDIDKFKKYNDYWGHPEGDKCIKKVANYIKNIQVEHDDVFGRYGGEEFIYISTHINYNQALKLGNHIRKEVENLGLYYMDKEEKRTVTISLGGVIGKSCDFSSMQKMIEIADMELYRAKDMGRNRTILKNINNNN